MERIKHLDHLLASIKTNINKKISKQDVKNRAIPDEPTKVRRNPMLDQIDEDSIRLLNTWRKDAKIDPKNIKETLCGPEIHLTEQIWEMCANDPELNDIYYYEDDRDAYRKKCLQAFIKLFKKFKWNRETYIKNNQPGAGVFHAFAAIESSIAVRFGVHVGLYVKTICTLGTERHHNLVDRGLSVQDIGCFALTELTHGTNAQGIQTTATYDVESESFWLNSMSERAMKFWIGGASEHANMAVVMANLVVSGKDYGPHAFVVQLRDDSNHRLNAGIVIGDCGPKYGYEAIDNGWILFRNLKVPREALLNKITDVAKDGTVTSQYKSKSKRFGVQLAALSGGRLYIADGVLKTTYNGLCIAYRYAAIRRQFGPPKEKEVTILSYPDVQNRLIPLIAKHTVQVNTARILTKVWHENTEKILDPENVAANELHALSSVFKPMATWHMSRLSHECREICGGLGISAYSGLPKIIHDIEVNVTWEGDNNVLLQQTARFLLKALNDKFKGKENVFESLKFQSTDPIEEEPIKVSEDFIELTDLAWLEKIFCMRTNLSIQKAGLKIQELFGDLGAYKAWNTMVPMYLKEMSMLFGLQFCFQNFLKHLDEYKNEENKKFLRSLLLVYAYSSFKEYPISLTGIFTRDIWDKINMNLQEQYEILIPNLLVFLDQMGAPDILLKSAIGSYDGNAYDRMSQQLFKDSKNFGRVGYWREILKWREGKSLNLNKSS